jgi:alcohol/geraniol dehydrogenase (NADP+)
LKTSTRREIAYCWSSFTSKGDRVSLISGEKSIGASPGGGPIEIVKMLDFCSRHGIEPIIEEFPLSRVNEAMAHLESGKARYRIVVE